MSLLKVEGLNLTLDGNHILQDVNLEVAAGEALGIVGESGSGKSMTARSIARLLPERASVSGLIEFEGKSLVDASEREMRNVRNGGISMIFQDPRAAINPVRTIGDFLTEAIRTNSDVSKSEARRRSIEVMEAVRVTRAESRLKAYPHELSGGLLQRMMIAATLLSEPSLLLADEPTTALDVTTQAEIMAILGELRKERGMALIFITHDLELAGATTDRISVMYEGKVVESQPSAELLANPQHPYSQALLAARPSMSEQDSRPLPASEADKPTEDPAGDGAKRAARRLRASAGSENSGPIIEVDSLTKSFGEHVAVDSVSFRLEAGISLAIVGESGSGKTTVARMLAGLERPTAGTMRVCGEDRDRPARRAAERRRRGEQLQIVFQDASTSLDPRQEVGDGMQELLRLHYHDLSGEDRRQYVTEMAELVGLDERHLRSRPGELSGGQRQRVTIARALAAEPRAVILDESLASLDVSLQAQILDLLAEIRELTGVTYILISHDLAVVRKLTSQIIVMRDGEVLEAGNTAEVLSDPQHPYTRLLCDSVPRPGWRPERVLDATGAASRP